MKKIIFACLAILLALGAYWFSRNPQKLEGISDSVSEVITPDFSKKNSLTTIKQQEQTELVEIDLEYPQTGFGAIDDVLPNELAVLAEEMKALAADSEEFIQDFGIPYSVQSDYEVTRNDDSILSFIVSIYQYTGGAHGISSTWTFVFDKQKNKLLSLEDVFEQETDYLFILSDAAVRELKTRDLLDNEEWLLEGAGAQKANFERFVLTAKEIRFIFDAYQVGPYAAGTQEVSFPLSNLQDILDSDYQTL